MRVSSGAPEPPSTVPVPEWEMVTWFAVAPWAMVMLVEPVEANVAFVQVPAQVPAYTVTSRPAVAVKVSGLPATPLATAVAVMVLAPAAPRVQLVGLAVPSEAVAWAPPATEPPPVAAAKVTPAPDTPLPAASVTFTLGAEEFTAETES